MSGGTEDKRGKNRNGSQDSLYMYKEYKGGFIGAFCEISKQNKYRSSLFWDVVQRRLFVCL